MPSRYAHKLILHLVIGLFINNIQAFDVWTYWREKNGEKARVWKQEDIGTLIQNALNMFFTQVLEFASFS